MQAGNDYNAAVAALNTLQSNFAIVDAIRKSGRGMNKDAIPEMIEWVKRLGYEPADFDQLNAIHIAGTKGKGSTSSFVSSILAQYRDEQRDEQRDEHPDEHPAVGNIGLYTSPHLRFVRERIQINNAPLSEAQFARYFFETWHRLEASARAAGHSDPTSRETKPVYFRFLTLMALHAYMSEGVSPAVIECGIGGEHDSTNILERPSVTAVTSLGIDHVAMLGSTLPEIAWHKAGIFKPGVPAFTAPQPESALAVLRDRARERSTELHVIPTHPLIASGAATLGLAAPFQHINASLAIAIASAHLRARGVPDIPAPTDQSAPLPPRFLRGLEAAYIGGRCETRRDAKLPNLSWHLDGGHTLESIELAGRWFGGVIGSDESAAAPSAARVLIFNQQTRDAGALAQKLFDSLSSVIATEQGQTPQGQDTKGPFGTVVFCTNETYLSAGYKSDLVSLNTSAADVEALSVQRGLAETWAKMAPGAEVRVVRTVEEAVGIAREVAAAAGTAGTGEAQAREGEKEQVRVLVTGSLHLVGGVVEVLEGEQEAC